MEAGARVSQTLFTNTIEVRVLVVELCLQIELICSCQMCST